MTRVWVVIVLWVIFGCLYVLDAVSRVQGRRKDGARPWHEWGRWQ
ncbi:MAG: hypothetical protein ACYC9Q_14980 [Bacillota bacterium]